MYKALLKAKNMNFEISQKENKISVIIAFRNEEDSIIACLESLKNQNYSPQNFQMVLCNDHSEDKSLLHVQDFIKENPQLNILLLENNQEQQGKKEAIKNAVKNANHEVLAFVDADCTVGNYWLKCISTMFNNNQTKMICGPVVFYNQESVFEKLLSLEFASLMAVTAASVFIKKPFICNAANMAIRKDAYYYFEDNSIQNKYASGDDVFQLHQIKKIFGPHSISFMYQKEAIVNTKAPANLKSFINQRIRWSSKTIGYSDRFAVFSAYLVFIVCVTIASGIIFSFFYGKLAVLFIVLFFIKSLVDTLLLNEFLKLIQRKSLLKWILLEQLLYVFYVPLIAIVSLKKTYKWKGRRIS
jgi:cellulose synthase/poly-beta-1,6-N-acetylglucosamine synthase-like glycosyltransferase